MASQVIAQPAWWARFGFDNSWLEKKGFDSFECMTCQLKILENVDWVVKSWPTLYAVNSWHEQFSVVIKLRLTQPVKLMNWLLVNVFGLFIYFKLLIYLIDDFFK